MKYDKSVYRSLALITQFGINMLVPVFLCTIAGVFLGKKFSMDWIVIPLFAIGALAGFRNVFIMAKKIYSQESPSRARGIRRKQPGYGEMPNGETEREERKNRHVKED